MSAPDSEPAAILPAAMAAERRRRFVHAVLTSGASKIFALLVQILALPLALHALGESRYAAFLSLQSLVGWISIFGLGLVPSLPKFIAASRAAHDHDGERNLIVSAIGAMFVISLAVFAGLSLLGILVTPQRLVAAAQIPAAELNVGYYFAAAISCLSFFSSIDPAIRAGSQELHRTNLWALAANIVVLLGLFLLARHPLPLWSFFVVLNLPNALFMIVDMVFLVPQRPYLVRGPVEFRKTAKQLSAHSNNALLIQASFALIVYLPTLAMAHLSNAHETALFGSIAIEMFFALASMNLIFQPLTQGLANAHSHNDTAWVVRTYRRSLFLVSVLGVLAVVLGWRVAPWLVRVWLGHGLVVTPLLGATFGAYFLVVCLALLHFYVLSAVGGLPETGKIYIFQSLLAFSLGSAFSLWYGAEGMAAGLTIGLFAVSWAPFLAVRKVLKAMPPLSGNGGGQVGDPSGP